MEHNKILIDNIDFLDFNEDQLNKFHNFYKFLIQENEKMNLTGITDLEQVYLKHFVDSLLFYKYIDIEAGQTIGDIGAGAGFPTIPLAIMREDIKFSVIEPIGKRCNFLNQVIELLDLKNVVVHNLRAEEALKLKKFDIVTARAVKRLDILTELCIPLVKVGGIFAPLKGKYEIVELTEGSKAADILCAKHVDTIEYNLQNGDQRCIYVYNKTGKTDKKYPRNFGQIKQNPLGRQNE